MEHHEPKRFSKRLENFVCAACGTEIAGNGYTDHCTNCLWSKHVDINPGDRKLKCMGLMEPIRTENTRNGFFIEYICQKCKMRKRFGAAKNDNEELLFRLLEG